MTNRRLFIPVIAASLVLGACKSDPAPPPAPIVPVQNDLDRQAAEQLRLQQQAEEEARARAEAEAEAERARLEGARRATREALLEMVFFEYDMADITAQAELALRTKVDILRGNPQVRMRIEGHADERGSSEYNVALSNERAEAVRDFLTGFGLDRDRFSIVSYGEDRPLVNASTEAAWARNRRAEFVITAGGDNINPIGGH